MSTRIEGIVDKLSSAEKFSDVEWVMGAPVVNYCNSVVDDKIQANMEAQGRAGVPAKIVRTSVGSCCDWCVALEGEYSYPGVPQEVFQRHDRCNCIVEYYPGDGRVQNAHTKDWYRFDADKMQQMREYGLDTKLLPEPKKLEFIASLNDFPKILGTFTPASLYNELIDRGFDVLSLSKGNLKGITFNNGGGYKVNYGGDGLLQYHPAYRSRHAGAYYKISSGAKGTRWYDLNGNIKVMR